MKSACYNYLVNFWPLTLLFTFFYVGCVAFQFKNRVSKVALTLFIGYLISYSVFPLLHLVGTQFPALLTENMANYFSSFFVALTFLFFSILIYSLEHENLTKRKKNIAIKIPILGFLLGWSFAFSSSTVFFWFVRPLVLITSLIVLRRKKEYFRLPYRYLLFSISFLIVSKILFLIDWPVWSGIFSFFSLISTMLFLNYNLVLLTFKKR